MRELDARTSHRHVVEAAGLLGLFEHGRDVALGDLKVAIGGQVDEQGAPELQGEQGQHGDEQERLDGQDPFGPCAVAHPHEEGAGRDPRGWTMWPQPG